MGTLFPTSFVPNSSWMIQQSKSRQWTKEENKMFESAIAIYDEHTPNRWTKVAAMIPGKSVLDVMNQYKELVSDVCDIEAGLVPSPDYFASSVTVELIDDSGLQTFRKRSRSSDQERKKGVPWTEEEHRRFLMGLEKYGKGDWRNISRKLVISRTPTQVASHAQKYYQRQQLSGGKDKRRPSIHDITTVVFTADTSEDKMNSIKSVSKENFCTTSPFEKFTTITDVVNCWSNSSDDDLMPLGSSYGGQSFMAHPCEIVSQYQDGYGTDHITNWNSQLQIQSTRYQIWG